MSLNFTINASAREGFESPIVGAQDHEVDHLSKISATIPANCPNYVVNESFAVDGNALVGLFLVADGPLVITLRDCADLSVGELELCEGVGVLWYQCIGFDHGITGNVAYMEVANDTDEEVQLVGRIGYDNNGVCPSP